MKKKFLSVTLASLLTILCILPCLTVSATAAENVNPDDYLVAHWDFEDSHAYTDTLTRVTDIANKGSYSDRINMEGGAPLADGVGSVGKAAGQAIVSHHITPNAKDCTDFSAMTVMMKMRVDDPYYNSDFMSGDFFNITKDGIYSIRCLFATTTQNNGQGTIASFKFQCTSLSTEQYCQNRAWGNSSVVTCPSGEWFFFAVSHYFNEENKSVVKLYFSVDGTNFQCVCTTVGTTAFTQEQIAAATTNNPQYQKIAFGKNLFGNYAEQKWGYSFDDARIYNTVLDEKGLELAAEAVTEETRVIGYQLSNAYLDSEGNSVYDARLIAEINSKDVEAAGFNVSVDTGSGAVVIPGDKTSVYTCYSSILGKDNSGAILTYNANTDRYLIALTIQGIPMDANPQFSVSSYFTDADGTETSRVKTFTINSDLIPD